MQSYEQSHLVNLSQSRVKRKHSTITEERIDVWRKTENAPYSQNPRKRNEV